jgi:hypothetical protein
MSDIGWSDSAVIAAGVSAVVALSVALLGHAISGRREMKTRRRAIYAEAYSWYSAYKEYPYVVRRRRASQPEEERLRISGELNDIQKQLSFYAAWISSESSAVSGRYAQLLSALRRVAGGSIREGWLSPPLASDSGMNITGVDLTELLPVEARYLEAVRDHLSPWPSRIRRLSRRVMSWWRERKIIKPGRDTGIAAGTPGT